MVIGNIKERRNFSGGGYIFAAGWRCRMDGCPSRQGSEVRVGALAGSGAST